LLAFQEEGTLAANFGRFFDCLGLEAHRICGQLLGERMANAAAREPRPLL